MMLHDKFKELQGVVKTHQAEKFPIDYALMSASAIFGSTLNEETEPFPKFDQAAAAAAEAGPKMKRSPETMNRLNEEDPAFVRSVSAMKGLGLEEGEGTEEK